MSYVMLNLLGAFVEIQVYGTLILVKNIFKLIVKQRGPVVLLFSITSCFQLNSSLNSKTKTGRLSSIST